MEVGGRITKFDRNYKMRTTLHVKIILKLRVKYILLVTSKNTTFVRISAWEKFINILGIWPVNTYRRKDIQTHT